MAISLSDSGKKDLKLQFRLALLQGEISASQAKAGAETSRPRRSSLKFIIKRPCIKE